MLHPAERKIRVESAHRHFSEGRHQERKSYVKSLFRYNERLRLRMSDWNFRRNRRLPFWKTRGLRNEGKEAVSTRIHIFMNSSLSKM